MEKFKIFWKDQIAKAFIFAQIVVLIFAYLGIKDYGPALLQTLFNFGK